MREDAPASGRRQARQCCQAIKVTGAQSILFLAGQVAYRKDGGTAHPGDFKAQARAVFGSLKTLVEAGSGTRANVVKITTYVTHLKDRRDFRVSATSSSGRAGRRPR